MVNKVILIGNLGKDPESKTFSNGGTVCNVTIATSERWTDKMTGERKEHTEWHNIVFNNRLAEIAQQYLRKGSKIYVEGSLRTRKWQDQQTGQDRYMTEIRASNMQMLDSKSSSFDDGGYQNSQAGFNPQVNTGQVPQQGGFNQTNSFTHNQGQNSFNNQNVQQPPMAPPPPLPTAPAVNQPPADDDIPF